jgi:uncharacterized protein
MKLWLLVALHFGCYGVIFLFAKFSAFSWLSISPETSTPTTAKLVHAFYTAFTFLIPALIFANAAMPERFEYYRLQRKVNFAPVLVVCFAMVTSVFFIDIIDRWNIGLITSPEWVAQRQQSLEFNAWATQTPGVGELLVFLFASAVVPAVCEELFFRGGMQQLILEWTRKPHATIIITAFIFSLFHFDPFQFIARFILGIGLGYFFWWSGSLRLSIAAHLAFNGFQIVGIYFAQQYPESWWAKAETTYILGAISLVVSLGAVFTLRNLLNRKSAPF